MSFANAIRITLVTGWLALFGSHALHYARPGLGLRELHDVAAVVNANLGRSFTCLLVDDQGGAGGHQLGSCTLSREREGAGFQRTTELRLTDRSFDQLVAALLPPGLRPGESVTTRLVSPDLPALSAHRTVAVFDARSRERTRTLHGELDLLRVDREVDGRPFSSLGCDGHGTVYVSRQHGAHLALMLERMDDLAHPAIPLWPVSA